MTTIHFIAGLIALIGGMVALLAPKGRPLHRWAGIQFTWAMLLMTSSALVITAYLRPNIVSVVSAVLTFYLVATGYLSVKRAFPNARALSIALMASAGCIGLLAFQLRSEALRLGASFPDGPAALLPVFGTIAIGAAILDSLALFGASASGTQRLIRHLWRMGLALWVATASFFLGQAKLFPKGIADSGVLVVPVVAVLVLLCTEILRIGFSATRRRSLIQRSNPGAVRPAGQSLPGATKVARDATVVGLPSDPVPHIHPLNETRP
jgi:uncharacterized membrane protein